MSDKERTVEPGCGFLVMFALMCLAFGSVAGSLHSISNSLNQIAVEQHK